jgi:Rrf2 family protein
MRLTKATSHAIRIAIDCAEANGALVKAADIAGRLDITQLNVFKIIHILSRAGFVEAVRGRHGGVRLARQAEAIRIGDIVRAIEATEMDVAGAEAATRRAKRNTKPQLNVIFDDALEAFISVLDQHTLADMAKTMRVLPQSAKSIPAKSANAKSRTRGSKTGLRGTPVLRG